MLSNYTIYTNRRKNHLRFFENGTGRLKLFAFVLPVFNLY